MTIKTIQEGFALMGATLDVTDKVVMVNFKGVTILIDLGLPEKDLEGIMFFLNLNITHWYKLIKEALAEEQKGGEL